MCTCMCCVLMPSHTWSLASSYTRVSSESPVWSSVRERLLRASRTWVRTCHKIHFQQAEVWCPSYGHRDHLGWGQHSPLHRPHLRSHCQSPWTGCEWTRLRGGPPSRRHAEGTAFPHFRCRYCSRETANHMCQFSAAVQHTRHANRSTTTPNEMTQGSANQCKLKTKL